jgi:hypothetical protein
MKDPLNTKTEPKVKWDLIEQRLLKISGTYDSVKMLNYGSFWSTVSNPNEDKGNELKKGWRISNGII